MTILTETRQRWRWLVLIATILGSLLAEPMILVSGIYLIPWADTFECSIGQVSIIASVATFSYHLGSLSGIWTDRIGYRAVVVMGGVFMAVGVLASAFVPSRIIMIFTFGFFSCFFAGTTFPAFNVALVSYFSKNFGTIRGISSAGTGLGIFAIPPLLQYLVNTYGWRGSLVVFSAIASHLVVLGMLLRPESAWKRVSSRKEQENRENPSIPMTKSKSNKSADLQEGSPISAKDNQHFKTDTDVNADVGIPLGYNNEAVEDDFGRTQEFVSNKDTSGFTTVTAVKCSHGSSHVASEDDAGLTVDVDVHKVKMSTSTCHVNVEIPIDADDKPKLSATKTETSLVNESITNDDTYRNERSSQVDTGDSNGQSNCNAVGDSLVLSDLDTAIPTENENSGKESTMEDDIFNQTGQVESHQIHISNGNNILDFPKANMHMTSDGEDDVVTEGEKTRPTQPTLTEDGLMDKTYSMKHKDGETSTGSPNDDLHPCDFGEVVQVISNGMNSAKSPSGSEGALASLNGLWSILRHSYRIYLLVLTAVFLGVAHDGVVNHLLTSLVYRGVEPQAASLLMSFVGIGSIVGRAASGFIVDHHLVRTSTLLGLAIFALGGTMILFRVVAIYWLYAIASFFFGATGGITFNLLVVFARECVGKMHMGRAITLIMVAAGLGSIVGPVMAGWLYDETQSYNLPFFTMGGILLAGGLMFAVEPTLRRMESEKAKGLLKRIQDRETQSAL